MNIRLSIALFVAFIFSVPLFAQCPPLGFPEPGNTCPDAPILCENLDGYCATINNNNLAQPFPCCSAAWTLNNDEWFAFFAGTTTLEIEIVPQNCSNDNSLLGLQGAIYDGCPINGGCNVMDVQCECTEDPFVLSANNYEVGKVYWIVLDGCNGNVCDYTVNVLEGSTIGFAPEDPGLIAGASAVCQGISSVYSIPLVNGATIYNWALTPLNAGTLTVDSDSVTVAWADTFSGFAKLCLTTSNQCYQNDNESCFDIEVVGNATRSESISLCPGDSVILDGQVYNQSGTIIDTLPSINGCDTIVTYTLTLSPYQTRSESISFCPGKSVTIGGQVYSQPGTVIDTLPSILGCDTIVTYTLTMLPYQTRSESISFCPGKSVTIGGQVYSQPGTVIDTLPANLGCDTIVTYALTLLTQPTLTETIAFCPGETIILGGAQYTQPDTVTLTIPSTTSGCDTIATYTLQFLTPTASNISIHCPDAITINVASGSNGTMVNYNPPSTGTDCICPGIALSLASGLASGSHFPVGLRSVCYTAKDSCGQFASCCFTVTIEEEDDACDTKVSGCMKYELLTITEDLVKNRTYRIRVTNNCTNKLIYTAIQIPDGQVAIDPANLSSYTAPSGNTYLVRNPNFTPQYSIRFSSVSDSIHSGESDIFKYTLPAQAMFTYFQVSTRLAPNISQSAHLNTFYCPIGVTPTDNRPIGERGKIPTGELYLNTKLLMFPNPASQVVGVETWGQTGNLIVQDAMGRTVVQQSVGSANTEFSVAGLSNGLYQVVFYGENVVQHGALMVQH